ncbi:MAG TPA: phage holin family protein [Burkholderiales bacterium]|nr:phage holin family protein [Burkholderiales bacterium]
MYVGEEQEASTSPGRSRPPGIVEAAKRFASSLLEQVQTRLELLTVEWAEEKSRLSVLLIALGLALFFVWMAIAFASLLAIALFWDTEQRIPVMTGIVGFYVLGAIVAGSIARSKMKLKSSLFAASAAELRKDRDLLESSQ